MASMCVRCGCVYSNHETQRGICPECGESATIEVPDSVRMGKVPMKVAMPQSLQELSGFHRLGDALERNAKATEKIYELLLIMFVFGVVSLFFGVVVIAAVWP